MQRRSFNSQVFVERKDLSAIFESCLVDSSATNPLGLLFHGEAGSGKTWFFQHLNAILFERYNKAKSVDTGSGDDRFTIFTLSIDKLEADPWRWWTHLRDSCRINYGTQPPITDHFAKNFRRFDIVSAQYARLLEMKDFTNSKLKFANSMESGLGKTVAENVQQYLTKGNYSFLPLASYLKSGATLLLDQVNKRGLEDEFQDSHRWTRDEFEERFPGMLARDINDLCKDYRENKLVILIDGHDRMFSARSSEEGKYLEEGLRSFCNALTGGLVCLFSQQPIPWFVSSGAHVAAAPPVSSLQVNLVGGDDDAPPMVDDDEWDRAGAEAGEGSDPLERASDIPARRRVRRARLTEFDEEMVRDFLNRRQLGAELDGELCRAIIRSTRLPFEIEEKANLLLEQLTDKARPLDRKALANRLEQPFDEFFGGLMEAKSDVEARFLRLLWRVDWFTLDLMANLAGAFRYPSSPDEAERVLGQAMIERSPETSRAHYWIDPHYLPHLQLDYLRNLERRYGQPKWPPARSEAVKALREKVWKHGRKPLQPMQKIWHAFSEQAANEYCVESSRIADAIHNLRMRDATRRGLSPADVQSLVSQEFEILMACLDARVAKADGKTRPPALLGDWSEDLVSEILEDALAASFELSSARAYEDAARMLNAFEGEIFVMLKGPGNFQRPFMRAFCAAGARAVEIRSRLMQRWQRDDDKIAVGERLDVWISSIDTILKSTNAEKPSWIVAYWHARLKAQYHLVYSKSKEGAERKKQRVFQFGSNRTRFLRSFDDLKALIEGSSQAITQTRHHKIAMVMFCLHEVRIRQLEGEDSKQLWNDVVASVYALHDDFPDDPEIFLLIAGLEQGNQRLSIAQSSQRKLKLLEYYSRLGGRIDILHALEKASVSHARHLLHLDAAASTSIGEEDLASELHEATSSAAARAEMDEIHALLRHEVEQSDSPPFELCKLHLKNLRKCADEGYLPADFEHLEKFLNKLFERLPSIATGRLGDFIHEATELAKAHRDAASVIFDQASCAFDAFDPVSVFTPDVTRAEVGRRAVNFALWAKFVSDLHRHSLRNDGPGGDPKKLDGVKAALDAVQSGLKEAPDFRDQLKPLQASLRAQWFFLLGRRILSGEDRWRELIEAYDQLGAEAVKDRAEWLRRICRLLEAPNQMAAPAPMELYKRFEETALEALPLELSYYASVVRARNSRDGSICATEREAREQSVASLGNGSDDTGEAGGTALSVSDVSASESAANSSAGANGEELRAVRNIAKSALAYEEIMRARGLPDPKRVRRVIADAVIACDPLLTVEDVLRKRLRARFASSVWLALHQLYDRNRNHISTSTDPDGRAIAAFCQGETANFFTDLFAFLSTFRLPESLRPRDVVLVEIDQATEALIDNGPRNDPGPLSIGALRGDRVVIPSNLISPAAFRVLRNTHPAMEDAGPPEADIMAAPTTRRAEQPVSAIIALSGATVPILATRRIVQVRSTQDCLVNATERGLEFFESVIELLYPGVIETSGSRSRFAIGSSNTWVTMVVSASIKSALLREGWFTDSLKVAIGLNRVMVMKCATQNGAEGIEKELREFASDGYRALSLVEFNGRLARYVAKAAELQKVSKKRAFESMFEKLFPGIALDVSQENAWWQIRTSDDRAKRFEESLGPGGLDGEVVDGISELAEERILEVAQVKWSKKTIRQVILLTEDGTLVRMSAEQAVALNTYFQEGREFLCRLGKGPRGALKLVSARPREFGEYELTDIVVVQMDRNTFTATVASGPDDARSDLTVVGRVDLARFARYGVTIGSVFPAQIKEIGGKATVVHIESAATPDMAARRIQATVRNYSAKNASYYVVPDDGYQNHIALPLATVRRAGYVSLEPGDRVTVDAFRQRNGLLAKTLLLCERKIRRQLRAVLGDPGPRSAGWLVTIDDPSLIGLKTSPPHLFIQQEQLVEAVDGQIVPKGARVLIDVQEAGNGTWKAAVNVKLDLANEGRWMLGRIRAVIAAGKVNPLAFASFPAENAQAFVPPSLRNCLPTDGIDGLWIEAKICRTKISGLEKLAVCALRRPRHSRDQLVRGIIADRRRDTGELAVRLEQESALFSVSPAMAIRADLPLKGVSGIPVVCRLDTFSGAKHITDIMFDEKRGWSNRLYALRPYGERSNVRILVGIDSAGKITIQSGDAFYQGLAQQAPGTIFSATGFDDEAGKARLAHVEVERHRIPWRYGFVTKLNPYGVSVCLLGGETRKISQTLLAKRGVVELTVGRIIRLTEMADAEGQPSVGMFEAQGEKDSWFLPALVVWFDPAKAYGKIALTQDEELDIRIDATRFASDIVWSKGLPVLISLDNVRRQTGKPEGSSTEFRARVRSARSIEISKLEWRAAEIIDCYPLGSAIMRLERPYEDFDETYIPPIFAQGADGSLSVGDRVFCQTVPGLRGRATAVNLVKIPFSGAQSSRRLACIEAIDYVGRQAQFTLLDTKERVTADHRAFAIDENDLGIMTPSDIVLIDVAHRDGDLFVVAMLEKLGRRLDRPQGYESPQMDAPN